MKNLFKTFVIAAILSFQFGTAQKMVINREVTTSEGSKMLLGAQTKDQFTKVPYAEWYNKEYADYKMDSLSLKNLRKEKIGSYNVVVFLGTWCGDSHREFPRFMKIMDSLKYPSQKMKIIALSRKKESPNGEEGLYNIKKVPTIILFKYGKEVGRIIETPKSGYIEKDLLDIIKH